ncbi:MAG TPA: T9SS type A sorting domain-containing protein, partial [Fibrobacteraceae bacterium]|nr:T9SS type A sorting domain-containing protein [Fibrobacteraceae bacterium]
YLESVQNFDLTITKNTYSFVFTMNAATDQNGRLSFNLGGATGTVFLDNVVIEKTETPPTVISEKTPLNQTKISYSHGNLFVKFDAQKNKKVQLLVYNLQGVEVMSKVLFAKDGIEQRMNFSTLSAGRYLVQVRSGNSIMKSMNILHY